MKNKFWIVIAVGMALVTVLLVRNYIEQERRKLMRELFVGREPTPVLVAIEDIPEQTIVKPTAVEVQTKPADAIQPYALSGPEQVGRKVAVVPIYKGEQILDSKLKAPEEADTLSMKTPPGKRAVTIGIDQISGVGGFIHPGDFIDILGVFTLPTPDGKQAAVTVTLLQRVLVLATGAQFSELEAKAAGVQEANSVTLALTPQETELVLFARKQGELQLSLRPKADSAVVADLPPMDLNALVGLILGPQFTQQPPPAKPEAPERKVEVYRGLQKEVVVLPE